MSKLAECHACPCRRTARFPIKGIGNPQAPVLVVATNPRDDDERNGKAFSGGTGVDVVRNWLPRLGLSLDRVFMTYILKCHIDQKAKPRAADVKMCRDLWLEKELTLMGKMGGVKAILALGAVPRDAILGKPKPKTGVAILEPTMGSVDFNGKAIAVFSLPLPTYFIAVPEHRVFFYNVTLPEVRKGLQSVLSVQ